MRTSCCNSKHLHKAQNGFVCLNHACENYLGTTRGRIDYSAWRNPLAVSVFAFLFLFPPDDFSMETKDLKSLSVPKVEEKPLTVENVQSELLAQKLLCPEHVLAQIRIESGNLTSSLLKRTNNMLGMRYPASRKTTACGMYIPSMDTVIIGSRSELKKYLRTENYAVYKTWKDGVADYKLWQESNFNVNERYLTFLGRVYAADSLYVQKIKHMTAQR